MQQIWIVKISENNTFFAKERAISNLPKSFSERANRYIGEENSLSYLTGRLLLKKALYTIGFSTSVLEKIHYSEHGKPNITGCNFSISHSNWYVTLAFSTKCSLGIDVEKKKNIDLKLFKYLFTELEWNSIIEAENSLERFYWFWVRKEALLKVVGCSLKDLKQLTVLENHGMYKGKRFHFKSFEFDTDFNGIVSMEEKVNFDAARIDFTDLLEE